MKKHLKFFAPALILLAVAACATMQDDNIPFSGPASVAYAGKLWTALETANLVGPNALHSRPYQGLLPHGAISTNVESTLIIGDNTGPVIVKNNFAGDGATINSVSANPGRYFVDVTVMYKREGYDLDNNDWFWAKYLPDGSLVKDPRGMQLAGRVAKGTDAGCIACHTAAPGGDLVFSNDRYR